MKLKLRRRFVLMLAAIFLLGGAAGYRFFTWYTDDVVTLLGQRLVERNALYEHGRLLGLVSREIALAQKMASSPVLKEWIAAETDPRRRDRALAELEDYRQSFHNRSYFFALAASGNYYYNDDKASGPANSPRYTLSEKVLKDGWFYTTLRKVKDIQLNVDTDRHLGLTRIWINTVVRDAAGRAVAVTGTGLDLSEFIQDFLSSVDEQTTNLLMDEHGAIQAHPDVSQIDFASARKIETSEFQNTLVNLISTPEQVATLRQAMADLMRGDTRSRSLELNIQGRRQLVGISWLPEIRWFVVSMSSPSVVSVSSGLPLAILLLALALVAALLVAALWFDRVVLSRLVTLDTAAEKLGRGEYQLALNDKTHDEIGRLTQAFATMATRVANYTRDLQQQVAERTAELEALANSDQLTGLLNRRGMTDRLNAEMNRLRREHRHFGLLQFDLDYFKNINDRYGHAAGDAVLNGLGALLRLNVRDYDACARWGGEEFLVAMFDVADEHELHAVAEKLAAAVRNAEFSYQGQTIRITTSIGMTLADPSGELDLALSRVDAACYQAKSAGRDCTASA
jgi:diguanylate cyclase (GGDEF)-like protein